MKRGGRLKQEAVNGCKELRGVRSEFVDSLTMKSENHSIKCRTAVKISSPEMRLDNDVSSQWKFQDTEGNALFFKTEI